MNTHQKKELPRQLFHIILGLTLVILLWLDLIGAWTLFIILIVGIGVSLLALRYKIPGVDWFLQTFERENTHPGKGAICFFIGTLLAIKLFPKDIALASIMILTLGDSISHYIGQFHGRTKHPFTEKKYLEGHIAGTIVGFLGALFFLPIHEASIAAFMAMIGEALEIELNHQIIDDNISVPLIAGVSVLILRTIIS